MVLITNKKLFNYEIIKKFTAGIKLKGFEVKSIFAGRGSLENAYVSNRGRELFLLNFYLPPYQEKDSKNYDPLRERKLLLKKNEIDYLLMEIKKPGQTLIPLKIFNKNNLLKVEIALVKGLKKYEKREKIKKREFVRTRERYLKRERVVK